MMEDQAAEMAMMVFQIAMFSGVVKLAMDNIKAVVQSEGYWDDVMLGGCVVIAFLFDVQFLQIILGSDPVFSIGNYLDNIVSGGVIAGGAGGFAKVVRDATKRKNALFEKKLNGGS